MQVDREYTQKVHHQHRMESIGGNLASALIEFHKSCPTITEDDDGAWGKFANLPGILSTIGPALRQHGLAVIQLPADTASGPGLMTMLVHTSGEYVSRTTPLEIQKGTTANGKPLNVTQEWGKAITYQRRYGLQAVLGMCAGIIDDDAAEEVSAPPVRSVKSPAPSAKPVQAVTEPAPAQSEASLQTKVQTELKPLFDAVNALGQAQQPPQDLFATWQEHYRTAFGDTVPLKATGADVQTQQQFDWTKQWLDMTQSNFANAQVPLPVTVG